MYEPDAFIVPGFNPGMPAINKPPIGLTDQEILCVIASLQTLGGTPTVTLQTSHRYYTAPGATPGEAPAEKAGLARSCLSPPPGRSDARRGRRPSSAAREEG